MEAFTIEAYLLPWWKLIVWLLVLAALFVSIRIAIRFDLNEWLEFRRRAKKEKDRLKAADNCSHAWTLYHRSPYSECNNCLAIIATSTLLAAIQLSDVRPIVFGENRDLRIEPVKGCVVVSDFIGKRQSAP